jgi:KipI family sensor histidine kinase inhibitor
MSIPEPTIRFATENAILLQFTEPSLNGVDVMLQRRINRLAEQLRSHELTGDLLQEVVAAPGSLLLCLHDGRKARRLLRAAEQLWNNPDTASSMPRVVEIPVHYGGTSGPDLETLASDCGLSCAELIRRHSNADYEVLCLGFLPGFAYLGGLDPQLHTPRKSTPAARISAGSVAIGGSSTGIYPVASPGGWHIIGRTHSVLFAPDRDNPCLLQPGDRIRFTVINHD